MSENPLEKWAEHIQVARRVRDWGYGESTHAPAAALADLADHAEAQQQRIAELEAQLAEAQAEAAQMGEAYLVENRACDSLERQLEDAKRGTLPDAETIAHLYRAAYEEWMEAHDWRTEFTDVIKVGIAEIFRAKLMEFASAEPEPITQEALREAGWSTFSSAGGVVMEYPPHIHNDDPQLGLHAWWYPDGGMMLSLRSFHNLHPVNHIRTMPDLAALYRLLTGKTLEAGNE